MQLLVAAGRLVVVQAVVSVATFEVCRAYGRRVAAGEGDVTEKVHRLRRAGITLNSAGIAVAILLLFFEFVGFARLVAGRLDAVGLPPRPVFVLVAFALVLASIVATLLAGHWGWYRHLLSITDGGGTPSRYVRRLGVAFAVGYGEFVAIGAVIALDPGALGAVVLVGFVVALGLIEPYLHDWSHPVRSAPARYAAELDALARETGVAVAGLKVVDGEGDVGGTAGVTGLLPGHRYVYVTDSLWEVLEPEERKGVLAHELGHLARGHLWGRLVAIVAFVVIVSGVSTAVSGFPAYLLVGVVGLAFLWVFGRLTHRHEYQADEYAARQVGAGTVIQALERLGELNFLKPERGGVFNALVEHPSLADRLDRLRTIEVPATTTRR